ncbi:tetratricopeptide repeat-containing protein [Nocardia gamkensis]|uniref:tetratricopeptide repeat-containing protein n=1 Tax=Nocardia gamkensis TaxID=352869 RepID=UPI0037C4F6E3
MTDANDNVIFVAMPGTIRGESARWKDVAQIKKHLYERIAREVSAQTGVEYRIRIEVDEDRAGNIHQSMFGAAMRAPVYIADLTGLNANVYLELGVRWAVKDCVTVLTCQSLHDDLAFNVSPSKAVKYGNDPEELETAATRIADMIVKGLRQPGYVDSLVRQNAELITLERHEVEELRAENARLAHQRGDDLIAAALNAEHDKRIQLLHQAVAVNPANVQAHFLLGESAIAASEYNDAIQYLTEATRLEPSFAPAWRELGVAQSRNGALDIAVDSVRQAVALDREDAEAHSILGGIYRRKARNHYDSTGRYDQVMLRQARDAYAEAGRIDNRNTYPLMNLARLDLQLAGSDEARRHHALADFEELEHLARYSARSEGDEDAWKWFDLADALAFTGRTEEALAASRDGFRRFEEPHRTSVGAAAAAPLQDILNSTPLPADIDAAVRALIASYRTAST